MPLHRPTRPSHHSIGKHIQLLDWSYTPIFRRALNLISAASTTGREKPGLLHGKARPSFQKLNVTSCTSIQPGQPSWVRLTLHKHGFYIVETRNDLLNEHGISIPNGIVEVQANHSFYLLGASFGFQPYLIPRNMTVAHFIEVDDNLLF